MTDLSVQDQGPAGTFARLGPEFVSNPYNAHTHLSFGGGIHDCLGASLARAEGQIAVGALLRRLPRLALGSEPLAWRPAPVFRGLSALPVTF